MLLNFRFSRWYITFPNMPNFLAIFKDNLTLDSLILSSFAYSIEVSTGVWESLSKYFG